MEGDGVKIAVAVMLMVVSLIISYLTVMAFEPIIMILTFFILTYLLVRLAMKVFPETAIDPRMFAVSIVLSAITSALIVWLGGSVVKAIAIFAIAWLIFRVLAKYLAKEIEKDLREVFE